MLTEDFDDEMQAQIFAASKLWSNLRRLWQNSKDSSRDATIQKLKDKMKAAKSGQEEEAEPAVLLDQNEDSQLALVPATPSDATTLQLPGKARQEAGLAAPYP